MAIIGEVRSTEIWAVYDMVPILLADRHVGLAENEQQFRDRARVVLMQRNAGCSDGFIQHTTDRAWAERVARKVRLELTPAALRLVAEYAASLPAGDGADELRAEVSRVTGKLGWTESPEG
jgi:hypothetical protein